MNPLSQAPAAGGNGDAARVPSKPLWMRMLLVAAAYCVMAGFSGYFSVWTDATSYFWLPAGLYLGVLLVTPRRDWWAMVIATGMGDYLFNEVFYPLESWPLHFLLAAHAGNSLSALLGAWIVERFAGRRISLNTMRELGWLVIGGGVLVLPITTCIGAMLIQVTAPEITLTANWLAWYCSDLLGIILLTPVLLTWFHAAPFPEVMRRPARVWEGAALLVGLIGVLVVCFSHNWPSQTETLYVAFPFVIWAAMRFGRRGTSLAILIAATIAHWFNAFGLGSIGSSSLDAQERTVEMLASVGVFALIGMVPAIALSAQWRAEARSQDSEARFARAVRGSTAGLWDWQLKTGEAYFAPRFKAILGYRGDEFPDRPESFFNALHPEDKAPVERALDAHFQDGSQPYNIDYRLRTKSGDYRWINARGTALFTPEGEAYRMSGSIIDITERKSLETQLQQSRKLEVIGQLAGGVAHDFNNILGATLINVEMMQLQKDRPPEERESLAELHKLSQRATRLTEQMLMFARRRPVELQPLELNHALFELSRMLTRLLPETIDLQLVSSSDPLWVRADSVMVDQVLINLCLNASDAMPQGGRLTMTATRRIVAADETDEHPDAQTGDYACLAISDTGIGMTESVKQHLFEPFFTTKGPGHGTGLGLASAHGITVQHKGWITVDSEPDHGTTFRVHLPLIAAPVSGPPSSAPPFPAETPGGTEHILLVEDDEAVRDSTARSLRLLGYTVTTAEDGPAALRAQTAAARIDLLVTDTVMPGGLSGLDLARHVKKTTPGLPVILTSGYSEQILQSDSVTKEGLHFLAKPYTRQGLARLIRKILTEGEKEPSR